MNRIAFIGDGYRRLAATLLADAPLESAAILFANRGRGLQGDRLVVSDSVIATEDDYLERTPDCAVLRPDFVAAALQRARRERHSLILVHTHPFAECPIFSPVDDRGEAVLAPTLFGRIPDGLHGSLVIGTAGFAARIFDSAGIALATVDRIVEVGTDLRVHDAPDPLNRPTSSDIYDRNIRAFGAAGQAMLARMRVGVVGVGGTGSFAVEELARLGVGTLVLVDDETLETTNLNRVVGARIEDVGRDKVDVAADLAHRGNPLVAVHAIPGNIVHEPIARALIDCDFIICCTDSHGSRAVINQLAYQYLLPTIDIGVRIDAEHERVAGVTYRVQMVGPGLSCLACHPLLDPDLVRRDLQTDAARTADPYILGFHEPQPAVVSINGSATSAAVTMFLTAVTPLPGSARHLVGRPLDGTSRSVVSTPRPGCIVCAPDNALARGDQWTAPWIPGSP